MRRGVLIILLLAVAFQGLSMSQDNMSMEELWGAANTNYAEARFEEALKGYTAIYEQGYVSEPLMYNIANCHFKLRNWGKAILYYERALKINPGNKDVKNNLKLAKDFAVDKIEELPEFVLTTWVRDSNYLLKSDTWAYLSLTFFLLSVLLLLNFRYGRSSVRRKASFFLSMASLLVGIIFTLFAWSQRSAYHRRDTAIVMMPVSTVRSSPDISGNTLFILHEGTKVKLIEQLGSWKRVELSDGRQGWISEGDIEMI